MLSAHKKYTEQAVSDCNIIDESTDECSRYFGDDTFLVDGSSEDDCDAHVRDIHCSDENGDSSVDQEALARKQHRIYDSMFPSLPSHTPKANSRDINSVPHSYAKSSKNSHSDVLQLSHSLTNQSVKIGTVVQKVASVCDVTIDASTTKNTGTTTFIIRGFKDNVSRARRLILSKVSVKGSLTVAVPRQVARFILGAKWQTLHKIENENGVKIKVPDDVQKPLSTEDISCETEDDWQIYGDYEGTLLAKSKIEKIVREKTAKVDRELALDHLYFPFIFGWSLEKLKELTRDFRVFVKLPENRRDITSSNHEQEIIVVSGDRDQVAAFIDFVTQSMLRFKSTLQSCGLSVPKVNHAFLVGPKYSFVQQLFLETDCYLIVPPRESSSDTVTLYGAQENLVRGFEKVLNRSKERCVRSYQFPSDSFEMIRWAWFQRMALNSLQKDLDEGISIQLHPESNGLTLLGELKGFEKAAEKLHSAFAEISSFLFSPLNLPDELLPLLDASMDDKPLSPSIRSYISSKYNLDFFHNVDSHSDTVWLVDKSASLKPNTVVAIKKQIRQRIDQICTFQSQTINVPDQFHLTIQGPNGENLEKMKQAVRQKCGTPEVLLGIRFPNDSSDEIMIRGAELPVKVCVEMIEELVKTLQERKDDIVKEAELSIETAFFVQHMMKQPAWLKELQESANVFFQPPDSVEVQDTDKTIVIVRGTQFAINLMKKKLEEKKHKLMNEIIDYVSIDPEYHGHLIGKNGSKLKRLQSTYDVLIVFPSSPLNKVKEENPSRIMVKGYKYDVKNAIEEINALVEWEKRQSYRFAFSIKKSFLGNLLGKSGSRIDTIRDQALDITPKSDAPHVLTIQLVDADKYSTLPTHNTENSKPLEVDENKIVVFLVGTQEACQNAKALISKVIDEIECFRSLQIDFPAIWVSWFCMHSKRRYTELLKQILGKDQDLNSIEKLVRIEFPCRQDVEKELQLSGAAATSPWTLKGNSELLKQLTSLLDSLKSTIKVVSFMVVSYEAKNIMGPRGETLNMILMKYPNVEIQVPNADRISTDPVFIYGFQEQVDACHQEIRTLMAAASSRRASTIASSDTRSRRSVQGLEQDTIEVEPSLHWHIIGHGGFCLQRVRELGCRVDLPRHDKNSSTVKIRGPNQSSIDDAKIIIRECLTQFQKQKKITKAVRIPTEYHGFIVGRAGAMIQRIRDEVYLEAKSAVITSPLDIGIFLQSRRSVPTDNVDLITVNAPEEKAIDLAITKILAIARQHGYKTPKELEAGQVVVAEEKFREQIVVPIPTLPLPEKNSLKLNEKLYAPYVCADKEAFMESEEGASMVKYYCE